MKQNHKQSHGPPHGRRTLVLLVAVAVPEINLATWCKYTGHPYGLLVTTTKRVNGTGLRHKTRPDVAHIPSRS